jgi:glycosyltransferase involved in cell wall biosynthesis
MIKEIESSNYEDLEILVMIEDKNKNLPSYLKEFEKSGYVKFYFVKGNRSIARNEGIKIAKNNILTFVDSDTNIKKGFIEKTLRDFEKGYGYVNYSVKPLEHEKKKRFFYYLKLMNFFQWLFTNMNVCRPYGFCMSVRKDICEKIKVNEEVFLSSLAGYGEDSEFGRRYGNYCRKKRIRGKYEGKLKVHTSMREWYRKGFWGMSKRAVLNTLFVPYLKKPLIESWRDEE